MISGGLVHVLVVIRVLSFHPRIHCCFVFKYHGHDDACMMMIHHARTVVWYSNLGKPIFKVCGERVCCITSGASQRPQSDVTIINLVKS